jgi:hypothetical protein
MPFRQPQICSSVFKAVMHSLYNFIHCFQEQGKPPGASLASSLTPHGRATHRVGFFFPVQWRTGGFIHPGTVAHRGDLFIPVQWRTRGFTHPGTVAHRVDLFIPGQWHTGWIYSSRDSGTPGGFIHPGTLAHRGDLFIPVQWRTVGIYSSRYSGAPGGFIHPGTVAHQGDLSIPGHWRTGGFILSGTLAYRRIHPIRNGRTHPCSSHIKIPTSSIQTFELVHHPLLTNLLCIGKMQQ